MNRGFDSGILHEEPPRTPALIPHGAEMFKVTCGENNITGLISHKVYMAVIRMCTNRCPLPAGVRSGVGSVVPGTKT